MPTFVSNSQIVHRHANEPDAEVQLSLLSGFELSAGGRPVATAPNAQRLLAFLALRERPQRRSTVAATLWMDTTDERAAANLRTALWKIRSRRADLVEINGNYVALSSHVDVDLIRVNAQARRLIEGTAELAPDDTDLRGLGQDLLPDWDEAWIEFERERVRQLRIHALEALCVRLSNCGRHGEAIDAGQAAVTAEPLRETAQRGLVEAHLAEGNVSEARRQYELYRRLLWEELRIEPSPSLRALIS